MADGGTVLLMWSIGLRKMGGPYSWCGALVYGRWGDRTPDVEHWSTEDGETVLLMWSIGLQKMEESYS